MSYTDDMTSDMHNLFSGLQGSAIICRCEYDDAGVVTSTVAQQANPAFEKQFGVHIPPGESVPLTQLLGEEQLPDWLAQCRYDPEEPPEVQLRRTGTRHRVEIISLDDNRKMLLLKDLTAHTRYEGQITQILSAVRDAVLFFAYPDRAAVWANTAAEDLAGTSQGGLHGMSSSRYLGMIRSDAGMYDPVEYAFDHGTEAWTECQSPQGEALILHAYPVNEPDGTTSGVVQTIRDITYRKQIEKQLQEALERADAANIVKDQFISNMSHELRTPLNGVVGVAELLLDSELTPQQQRFASMIQQSGTKLHEVVQDILAFTQLETEELRAQSIRFHLASLIRESAEPFKKKAESKGVEMQVTIESSLQLWVIGQPGRLRQIIRSLLDNAVKFTKTGSILVTASWLHRSSDESPMIYRFSVQDTGIGIDPQFHTIIFEPFQQVESGFTRRYGGLGLGLALAQRQARIMGSELRLSSDGESGSTVSFDIELMPTVPGVEMAYTGRSVSAEEHFGDSAGDCGSKTSSAESLSGSKNKTNLRILVAEDDRINQRVITAILRAQGHVVEMVENGRQAIEALKHGDYELVLMDIQMPDIDGIHAVSILRDPASGVRNPRVPVVAVTAFTADLDRTACIDAGMDAFLGKPVSASKLMAAVQSYAISRNTTK